MAGGGQSSGDFLKGFPQASSGTAADNPQASMGLHPSVAPWMMGNMGQMGQQMMQAGQGHPMSAPMHRGPPPGLMGGMNMPPPPMGQQPVTPQMMNQALLNHTGLMGGALNGGNLSGRY